MGAVIAVPRTHPCGEPGAVVGQDRAFWIAPIKGVENAVHSYTRMFLYPSVAQMIDFSGFDDFERMQRAIENVNRTQGYLRVVGAYQDVLRHDQLVQRTIEEANWTRNFLRKAGLTDEMLRQAELMHRAVEESSQTREYLYLVGLTDETLRQAELLRQIADSAYGLHPAILARQQFERTIQNALRYADYQQFENLYRPLKLLEEMRVHQRHRQVVKVLARRGWTSLEHYFNEYNFSKVLGFNKSKQTKQIDLYICSQFSKVKHQKQRSSILRAAVQHIDKQYATTRTATMPHRSPCSSHWLMAWLDK